MTTTAVSINGIDTSALGAFIQEVTRRPRAGEAGFRAFTRWTGGTASETDITEWELGGQKLPRNFKIRSDEPPELCGQATAPNPQEILMAGLNACMMVGYVACCSLLGIEIEALEIKSEGVLDLRGFLGIDKDVKPGYEELRYSVYIKGNGTPEQFRQVHEMVMATSPNFSNLSQPIRMHPRLIIG